MDAISYSKAAQQEQRIKKFIANPDSTSGVVTVPTTIATGETITIPTGRMAVLPNLQVDGELVVEGEVFIPSGATMTGLVEKVASTNNAIVRFNGTTGAVQNSGVIIDDTNQIILSPTNTSANWVDNSLGFHGVVGTTLRGKAGIVFDLSLYNAGGTSAILTHTSAGLVALNDGKLNIDSAGNVLVTGSGGLGYGTGSGGTVTQLTSKSTPVTLNKPCGQIIMNNASMAAGTTVTFQLSNSVIGANDVVSINAVAGASVLANYTIKAVGTENGNTYISVQNISGGALAEAFVLNFAVIKGVIS